MLSDAKLDFIIEFSVFATFLFGGGGYPDLPPNPFLPKRGLYLPVKIKWNRPSHVTNIHHSLGTPFLKKKPYASFTVCGITISQIVCIFYSQKMDESWDSCQEQWWYFYTNCVNVNAIGRLIVSVHLSEQCQSPIHADRTLKSRVVPQLCQFGAISCKGYRYHLTQFVCQVLNCIKRLQFLIEKHFIRSFEFSGGGGLSSSTNQLPIYIIRILLMTVCARLTSSKITDEKEKKYHIFIYLCYLSMECGWWTYILDNIATRRITTKTSHLSDTQKSFHKRGVFFLRYFLLRLTKEFFSSIW